MSLERARKPAAPAQHAPGAGRTAAGPAAGPQVARVLQQAGQPLPPLLRQQVQACFGQDFADVRIHADGAAAASAAEQGAQAYTVGPHIVFGAGRFPPQDHAGRHLLGHELAHVVQQRRGGAAPEADPHASHEGDADRAASQLAAGQTQVQVEAATGVGMARAPLPDDDERRKGQASATVLQQRVLRPDPRPKTQVEGNPDKSRGTRAEVTVPFDRYAGADWNHLGGGSETASSRPSLARVSSTDAQQGRQEGTAGIDFLVENVRTGRLVIGEQKATQSSEFAKATAITAYLDVNLAHSIQVLRQRIQDGQVHPAEVTRLQATIERLQATHQALQNPTNDTRLPPDVVFELTNVGGKGKAIGNEHLKLLEKKYGRTPGFLQHLLERTYVRDPELAKARGRPREGQRGSDADPDVVPAMELLNAPARDTLERIKSGKSEQAWKRERQALEKARRAEERQQREARKKAEKQARAERKAALDAQRQAAKKQLALDANRMAEQARQQHLDELRERRAQSAEPEPRTKRARKADETAANQAGRQARRAYLAEQARRHKAEQEARQREQAQQRAARRQAEAQAKAQKRQAATQARQHKLAHDQAVAAALAKVDAQPRMTPQDWSKLPAAERQLLERAAAQDPALARKLHEKVNAQQTADFEQGAKRRNAQADAHNRRQPSKNEHRASQAAHTMNQAAAGIRAFDAFDDARKQGKGRGEAAFEAGKTYVENTNPVLGAVATFESRMKKEKLPDGREQQYYGEDAGDAFFGTLGENIAGHVVPGSAADQLVNAGANLFGAADDHAQRGDPAAAARGPSTLRSSADLAAELTPSRMFAQTVGGGLRAYYDLGKAAGGQTSGVDKFADDALRGKLGAVLQPWAMAADFLGEFGGHDAATALGRTVKKSEDTTLGRLGNASGDAMFELGQSKAAKAGRYGPAAQTASTVLGVTSDMIAGKSFHQAIDDAAGQGSLDAKAVAGVRDSASAAAAKAEQVWREDVPAARQRAAAAIDRTIDQAKQVYDHPGETAGRAWDALKRLGDWQP